MCHFIFGSGRVQVFYFYLVQTFKMTTFLFKQLQEGQIFDL